MTPEKNIIVWESLKWKAFDSLSWKEENKERRFTGHIVGTIENRPIAIHYLIETDLEWRTQHFLISNLNDPDTVLELYSDENGKWFDRDEAVTQLEECMDIDISLTPFTNTLPIRRLNAAKDKRIAIDVIYIQLPGFTMKRATQYYTKLSEDRFLYENATGFKAELKIDKNSMVIEYPGLFQKVFPV